MKGASHQQMRPQSFCEDRRKNDQNRNNEKGDEISVPPVSHYPGEEIHDGEYHDDKVVIPGYGGEDQTQGQDHGCLETEVFVVYQPLQALSEDYHNHNDRQESDWHHKTSRQSEMSQQLREKPV